MQYQENTCALRNGAARFAIERPHKMNGPREQRQPDVPRWLK